MHFQNHTSKRWTLGRPATESGKVPIFPKLTKFPWSLISIADGHIEKQYIKLSICIIKVKLQVPSTSVALGEAEQDNVQEQTPWRQTAWVGIQALLLNSMFSWENYLTSWCLSFLIYKIEEIIMPISRVNLWDVNNEST